MKPLTLLRVFYYICSMKNQVNIVNKKAKFEYEFIRTEVGGIMLMGSEVKSIRDGKISLSESFCTFINDELFLRNANISEMSSDYTHKSNQDRKILLKRKELSRLQKELIKGLTIVPYRVFLNDKGLIKIEVVLAKGKKLHDKRETIKVRDLDREIKRNS
jgi:SsrA-binding protein